MQKGIAFSSQPAVFAWKARMLISAMQQGNELLAGWEVPNNDCASLRCSCSRAFRASWCWMRATGRRPGWRA